MTENEVPEAGPDDVAFSLTWQPDGEALRGELAARNVGNRRVRLTGKPRIVPLDTAGQPLAAEAIMTLELLVPGYVELEPGESATAPVGWAGWDGPAAGPRVRVGWPGGQVDVAADGPREPAGNGPATNLWSSWFVRADS
ncbi:DUF4232 domain-containing protein [Jatrophihabitans sp.]|uniref:DUF4232 domain-containing protein n=1 Tax=Jatrophihabitans sp. TaxID=1932789 RepID=UPI002C35D3C5|nr:DUF4232 domain-containing protein [Jatrophihabitans sp.]